MTATDGPGARIRAARVRAGLSLSQLARDAGVSKGYISKLENRPAENVRPGGATLARIASALGVPITDLL